MAKIRILLKRQRLIKKPYSSQLSISTIYTQLIFKKWFPLTELTLMGSIKSHKKLQLSILSQLTKSWSQYAQIKLSRCGTLIPSMPWKVLLLLNMESLFVWLLVKIKTFYSVELHKGMFLDSMLKKLVKILSLYLNKGL